MNAKHFMFVVATVLSSCGLLSCERTKIGDILADPGSFNNKQVAVAGEVTQSFGASFGSFGQGAYEISDGTGKLWVYSEGRGVPSKGAHVGVKGRIAPT